MAKVLNKGWEGIRAEVLEAQGKLAADDPDYESKAEYYECALIVLDAVEK